jgi:hypothetical protein
VVLGFLILVLAALYSVRQQDHVNQQLCQSTLSNREAVRTTWNAARQALLANQTSDEGRRAVNDFFDDILRVVPPLECRDSNPSPKER